MQLQNVGKIRESKSPTADKMAGKMRAQDVCLYAHFCISCRYGRWQKYSEYVTMSP